MSLSLQDQRPKPSAVSLHHLSCVSATPLLTSLSLFRELTIPTRYLWERQVHLRQERQVYLRENSLSHQHAPILGMLTSCLSSALSLAVSSLRVCVCECVCAFVHACMCVCVHMFMHVYLCVYIVCVCVCVVCVCVYVWMCEFA